MQWVATIQLFHEDFEQTSKRRIGFGLGRLNVGILRPRPPTYPTTANSERIPRTQLFRFIPALAGHARAAASRTRSLFSGDYAGNSARLLRAANRHQSSD